MRYKEQLAKLNEAFSNIDINGQRNNNGFFSVKDTSKLKNAVNIIKNFKFLNPELKNVLSLTYFMETPLEVIELPQQIYTSFHSQMTALKNRISHSIHEKYNF